MYKSFPVNHFISKETLAKFFRESHESTNSVVDPLNLQKNMIERWLKEWYVAYLLKKWDSFTNGSSTIRHVPCVPLDVQIYNVYHVLNTAFQQESFNRYGKGQEIYIKENG